MNIDFEFDQEFRAMLESGDPYSETYVRLYDAAGDDIFQSLFGTPELVVSVASLINELLKSASKLQSGAQCTLSLYLENRKMVFSPSGDDEVAIQVPDHGSNEGREEVHIENDPFIVEVETVAQEFLDTAGQANEKLAEDPALLRIQARIEDLRN
jgi:hypothetical protein